MHDIATRSLSETSDDRFDHEVLGIPAHEPEPTPQWAPGEACTLPRTQQPLREAEFAALFVTALRGIERPSRIWLRLEFDPCDEIEMTTRDLLARESACCTFFDFQLTSTDTGLAQDVRVPDARIDVLDGLARHAGGARATAPTRAGGDRVTRPLRSGQLATAAEVSVQTLRYYERRGLLPGPRRAVGGAP